MRSRRYMRSNRARRTIALVVVLSAAFLLFGCQVTAGESGNAGETGNAGGSANEDDSEDAGESENLGESDDSVDHQVVAEIVADGLSRPWAIVFLPSEQGDFALVTERAGRLNVVDLEDGDTRPVAGLPEIHTPGRGGLLDVELHPEFGETDNRWVYLTYVTAGDGGYALTVGRGWLDEEASRLERFEQLFVATPYDTGNHYGARMVFDDEGFLYVTSGDRQAPHSLQDDHPSQNLSSHHGKTLRLNADGSVPEDNPFVGNADALNAVYTYGHRNHQGMAVHPDTGVIWQNEHGEQDGDEINVLDIHGEAAGSNYGWPIATYGVDYRDASDVGMLPHESPDTVNPVHWWEEGDDGGFPPSGLVFYRGQAFSGWEGNMLMGNLADRYLARFEVEGEQVLTEHRLLEGRGWRIRHVNVHPETGEIYVLVDANRAPVVRLYPEDG